MRALCRVRAGLSCWELRSGGVVLRADNGQGRATPNAVRNAVYASRATALTMKLLPDGTVFHDRTAQKILIRRQEQGHQYAEAQLIALGAPVPRAGCNPAIWLREALVAVGARNVRHRGAHRFCGRSPRVAAWPTTLPRQGARRR
jgi:hypothetical protein